MSKQTTRPTEKSTDQIHVASINTEGAMNNRQYIQDLSNRYDVLCIQEHWLNSYELNGLSELIPHMKSFIKTDDDSDDTQTNYLRKAASKGITILWKKSLDSKIKSLKFGNNSLQAIVLDNNLVMVNC